MYKQLIKAGIPAHMPLGKDFWDTAEVKTAMALLRCILQPAVAGDVLKRRLVKKSAVPVPLTAGLGELEI